MNIIFIQVIIRNNNKLKNGQILEKLSAVFKRCSHVETIEVHYSVQDFSQINALLGNATVNQISVDKQTKFSTETRWVHIELRRWIWTFNALFSTFLYAVYIVFSSIVVIISFCLYFSAALLELIRTNSVEIFVLNCAKHTSNWNLTETGWNSNYFTIFSDSLSQVFTSSSTKQSILWKLSYF